jgi:endothelin-converting enzyme/putative endopeptidase
LRGILQKASTGGPNRSAIEQKIGDYYGACVDEKSADAKGLDPLKPEFDRIATVKNKADLIDAVAHNHMIGAN